MTPREYGVQLAGAAGPLSAEQIEQAARILASVEAHESGEPVA